MRWLFAALHLIALGIGPGAIWARARALRGPLDLAGMKQTLEADSWWGIAALLWIGTGVTRVFGGFEKGTDYYLQNPLFLLKMGLLAAILVLEVAPMIALIRWRIALAKGRTPDTRGARHFGATSFLQAGLVLLMVGLAAAMARGYGATYGH
jgi:putative membrane protein